MIQVLKSKEEYEMLPTIHRINADFIAYYNGVGSGNWSVVKSRHSETGIVGTFLLKVYVGEVIMNDLSSRRKNE